MAVQIHSSGGRRSLNADLNLVPFIDLLSVCITFLIATAVWIELASLPVDQAIGGGSVAPAVPPLTVSLRVDGIAVARSGGFEVVAPRAGDSYAWAGLDAALASDRSAFPDERAVVIVTADGVPYGAMIHALDRTRAHDYVDTMLAGSPE